MSIYVYLIVEPLRIGCWGQCRIYCYRGKHEVVLGVVLYKSTCAAVDVPYAFVHLREARWM
jgi:hypothetical protein